MQAVEAAEEQSSRCSRCCTCHAGHCCPSMATRSEVMAMLYPSMSSNIPPECDSEPIPPPYESQSIPKAQAVQPPCHMLPCRGRELESHVPASSYPLSPLEPVPSYDLPCSSAPFLQTKADPHNPDTGVASPECDGDQPPAYCQTVRYPIRLATEPYLYS